MFGQQNSTISTVYVISSQTQDVYGKITLDHPTTISQRGWFEEVTDERRAIEGDTFRRQGTFTTSFLANLDIGNIITIVPDQIGQEAAQITRNWRIENRGAFAGFTHNNSRIRRLKLSLVEEAS